jgi:hypothetical protein
MAGRKRLDTQPTEERASHETRARHIRRTEGGINTKDEEEHELSLREEKQRPEASPGTGSRSSARGHEEREHPRW